MDLRPVEIAMRQFSRTFLGADPAEVKQFLAEAAATLERVNGELSRAILDRTALQTALRETSAEVEALREQLTEAREKLASYQEREGLIARAWLSAQQVTEDLARESKDQADQLIAEANATAKDTVRSARKASADLLKATRTRANQAIQAADRVAASRIAEAQLEAGRLMEEARLAAAEAQESARRQIEEFIARLEAFLAVRDDMSRQLDALARSHADSLEVVGRMHAEVEETILPALRGLIGRLVEKDGHLPEGPTPARLRELPAQAAVSPAPSTPHPAGTSAEGQGALEPLTNGGQRARVTPEAGEIVVSPVLSYLQATKLVTAVSRVKGVRSARLRAYSKGSITIEVSIDEGTFAALHPNLIDGFPLDIVEATDRRLVLRLANSGSLRSSGGVHRPEG